MKENEDYTITKGERFMCVKTLVVDLGDRLVEVFTENLYYQSFDDGHITDNQNFSYRVKEYLFKEHFVRTYNE